MCIRGSTSGNNFLYQLLVCGPTRGNFMVKPPKFSGAICGDLHRTQWEIGSPLMMRWQNLGALNAMEKCRVF